MRQNLAQPNFERKPHLRFAVTPDCNFSCVYCRPGGEGTPTNEILTFEEMLILLKISSDVGFKHVKITGGEPLSRERKKKDVITLIQEISKKKYFDDIQLVTNGSLLYYYAEPLAKSGLDSLTVSLDTSDAEKFKQITGRDYFDEVLKGIEAVRSYDLPVKINSVIFKNNVSDIPGLIKISKKFGTTLKLLDYMNVDSKKKEWSKNYVNFDQVRNYLDSRSVKKEIMLPPGGLGTPMPVYILEGGTRVIVKDSRIGTNYNDLCKKCNNYPCQDALISLRITADGSLKRCLIRDDNLIYTLSDLRKGDLDAVRKKLSEAHELLMTAKYYENAWEPSC